MEQLPASVILVVALLTAFLVFVTALQYAVADYFTRNRLIMTGFFLFIVSTLTISYWPFFFATLPYTIPAGIVGLGVGYGLGVRTAREKLAEQGKRYYTRHFAHIHLGDLSQFSWWSFANYYTAVGALALINLVGLTTVIFHNLRPLTLLTSAFGAFLIGSIAPYLAHLWSIRPAQNNNSATSEA